MWSKKKQTQIKKQAYQQRKLKNKKIIKIIFTSTKTVTSLLTFAKITKIQKQEQKNDSNHSKTETSEKYKNVLYNKTNKNIQFKSRKKKYLITWEKIMLNQVSMFMKNQKGIRKTLYC